MSDVMKTLFLNPPSFEGYDGGASSRWPATREIESYWYPVWLAYPAGLLEGSRLLDASPHKVTPEETVGRLVIWRETLGIIRRFPLLGTGVGTFADAMFVYQKTSRQVLFNHAHNEYLQVATEGGAVIAVAIGAGLVMLTRTARGRPGLATTVCARGA